jgi:hypothetical protein
MNQSKQDRDNRSNQLNPNNDAFRKSRGIAEEPAPQPVPPSTSKDSSKDSTGSQK